MSAVTKLAAIREPGYPIGAPAPCWFTCPCGAKHRAFQEDITCACGARWTADGYRRASLPADPVALVDHVISLMERPMAKPKKVECACEAVTHEAMVEIIGRLACSRTDVPLAALVAEARALLAKIEGRA